MDKKLTIVYIGNKLSVHGRTPTAIDILVPRFEEQGHTVHAASSKMNSASRMLDMVRCIYKHRKDADLVLIDTYSTKAFYFAWLCSKVTRRYGLKYIPILHGGNLPHRIARSQELSRQLLSNSFTNVTVSTYLHTVILKEDYPSTLIPNSIVLNDYTFKQRRILQPKLLWVRAFHETYNPKMAVAVVSELKKTHPDVQLTMVGPDIDGSMEECIAEVAKLKLHKQIKFTGKLSKQEWLTLSQQHDIFINTSNYDNQPVSVLEAMALGLPVVSTNVGGMSYLITDKKNGILVESGNVYNMTDTIRELLSNIELAEALSQNGRAHTEQYDWSTVKQKWQMLFDAIQP